MKNIDFTTVKTNFLKYGTYVVMIVLAFILLIQRAHVSGLSVAIEHQKEIAAESYNKSKLFLNEANKLKEKGLKLNENIANLKKDSLRSAIKIKRLNVILSEKLSEIKQYKTNDIASYYMKRYKANKGVVITQHGVSLNDTIAIKNISELVTFDNTKEELKIVKGEVINKNEIIKEQDKVIINSEQQNNTLNLSIIEINKAFENSEATAKANEKLYKKEKTKKNLWKVVSGAVLAGATYLVIFK